MNLVGPGGLLNQLTKNVLEAALEARLTEHLDDEHGQAAIAANMHNDTRSKTVLTEIGPLCRSLNTLHDITTTPKYRRQQRSWGVTRYKSFIEASFMKSHSSRRCALRSPLG
uniref:hypothetical protein n=1 Tax=Arthrobacter sedimenti TaxID=2694931 RepID=UPI00177C030E|nr:hypothetical protein [Arthrobacter sedimenti]